MIKIMNTKEKEPNLNENKSEQQGYIYNNKFNSEREIITVKNKKNEENKLKIIFFLLQKLDLFCF